MKKLIAVAAATLALAGGVGAAIMATTSTVPVTVTVPYTVGDQSGNVVVTKDVEVPIETVTVTVTEPPTTTTEPPPPPDVCPNIDGVQSTVPDGMIVDANGNCVTPPPPPPGDNVIRVNQRYTCNGPVNLDLVKVTVDDSHVVTPAVQIAAGCTGRIGRIEIDNANGDGIHIGAFAHDLTIGGGYVRSPLGGCTLCGPLHVDGIQVMGGQRITMNNLEVSYLDATNSALYINQGSGGQDRPTDVVCDGCTFRRQPSRNRVVRIGDSLRSGIRNSTVYWCGTGPSCDAPTAAAIWFNGLQTDPVNENNTLLLAS